MEAVEESAYWRVPSLAKVRDITLADYAGATGGRAVEVTPNVAVMATRQSWLVWTRGRLTDLPATWYGLDAALELRCREIGEEPDPQALIEIDSTPRSQWNDPPEEPEETP